MPNFRANFLKMLHIFWTLIFVPLTHASRVGNAHLYPHGASTSNVPQSRALCVAGAALQGLGGGGDLKLGPTKDCERFGAMLASKGVHVCYAHAHSTSLPHDLRSSSARGAILAKIRAYFAAPAPVLNILYYSGHGIAGRAGDDDTRGALCVGAPPELSLLSLAELRAEAAARDVVLVGHRGRKQTYIDAIERDYLLTLNDILGEWSKIVRRASDASRPSPRLLICADSCYSGRLVAQLRDRRRSEQPHLEVAIQAAGNARQTVGQSHPDKDISHAGERFSDAGCLTAYLTAKQEFHVRWTQAWQHPQYYCSWDTAAYDHPSTSVPLGNGFMLRTYNQPEHR